MQNLKKTLGIRISLKGSQTKPLATNQIKPQGVNPYPKEGFKLRTKLLVPRYATSGI